jgi:hypothetical protein
MPCPAGSRACPFSMRLLWLREGRAESMAPKAPRYYRLQSAWGVGRGGPRIKIDFPDLTALRAGVSLEFLERRYHQKVPASATIIGKRRKVPGFILAIESVLIATASFKAVVDERAPGAAEFRPLLLQWEDGSPVPDQWYLCNLLQRVDCIDAEFMGLKRPRPVEPQIESTRTDPMTEEEYRLSEVRRNITAVMVAYVDPAKIGSAQIFRPRWTTKWVIVTDPMLKALKKAGVVGLGPLRLGTRDDPL